MAFLGREHRVTPAKWLSCDGQVWREKYRDVLCMASFYCVDFRCFAAEREKLGSEYGTNACRVVKED